MERYTLTWRILITLLILALLLPGWGLLSTPSDFENLPMMNANAIGKVSPLDR